MHQFGDRVMVLSPKGLLKAVVVHRYRSKDGTRCRYGIMFLRNEETGEGHTPGKAFTEFELMRGWDVTQVHDLFGRYMSVSREADLVVVRVENRRVMRLPLGAADELVRAMADVQEKGEGMTLAACADDDGSVVHIERHKGSYVFLRFSKNKTRKIFTLRPVHMSALALQVLEATIASPKSLVEDPASEATSVTPTAPTSGDADPKASTTPSPGSDPPPSEPRRRKYRSHSQLMAFMDCGFKYLKNNVERVSQKPSYALIGGRAQHGMIEWFEKKAHYSRSQNRKDFWPTPAQTRAKFQTLFGMEMSTELLRVAGSEYADPDTWSKANKGKEDMEWWLNDGAMMAQVYAEMNPPNRKFMTMQLSPGTLALEVKFEKQWGPIIQTGYIDQITVDDHGVVDIIDLKSGRMIGTDQGLQVISEAHWVQEQFPELTVRGGFYYDLRKGELSRLYTMEEFSAKAIEFVYREFDRAEREEIYLPRLSNMCGSCFVRHVCPFGGSAPFEGDDGRMVK